MNYLNEWQLVDRLEYLLETYQNHSFKLTTDYNWWNSINKNIFYDLIKKKGYSFKIEDYWIFFPRSKFPVPTTISESCILNFDDKRFPIFDKQQADELPFDGHEYNDKFLNEHSNANEKYEHYIKTIE